MSRRLIRADHVYGLALSYAIHGIIAIDQAKIHLALGYEIGTLTVACRDRGGVPLEIIHKLTRSLLSPRNEKCGHLGSGGAKEGIRDDCPAFPPGIGVGEDGIRFIR